WPIVFVILTVIFFGRPLPPLCFKVLVFLSFSTLYRTIETGNW
ncbi:1021_t:CDS:1, partial [Ambispora leptoticha]